VKLVDHNGTDLLLQDTGEDGPYVLKVGIVDTSGSFLGGNAGIPICVSFPKITGGTASIPVAAATESVKLLDSNAGRVVATLYNNSSTPCCVAFTNPASLTEFAVKLTPGSYYETPTGYAGPIYGYWEGSPTGTMLVTEVA
jgi:hypothetical protein